MIRRILLSLTFLALLMPALVSAQVFVPGYLRRDGTYCAAALSQRPRWEPVQQLPPSQRDRPQYPARRTYARVQSQRL